MELITNKNGITIKFSAMYNNIKNDLLHLIGKYRVNEDDIFNKLNVGNDYFNEIFNNLMCEELYKHEKFYFLFENEAISFYRIIDKDYPFTNSVYLKMNDNYTKILLSNNSGNLLYVCRNDYTIIPIHADDEIAFIIFRLIDDMDYNKILLNYYI